MENISNIRKIAKISKFAKIFILLWLIILPSFAAMIIFMPQFSVQDYLIPVPLMNALKEYKHIQPPP